MTLTAPRRRTVARTSPPVVAFMSSCSNPDSAPAYLTEVGGQPVLWHTMMHFASHGARDFLVAAPRHQREHFERVGGGHPVGVAPLALDVLDTGYEETAGAKVRRLMEHAGKRTFVLATGDALSDIDLDDLLSFHRAHGRLATVVAVRPAARFGRLELSGSQVTDFAEKPEFEQGWTSAGLCVLEPGVSDYVGCDDLAWEEAALDRVARNGQLMAYKHQSFWGPIETLRDRQVLEKLWQAGNPPWKNWTD